MILQKTKGIKGGSIYQNETGKDYLLRQVNRGYEGRKNPPIFYLEKVEKPKNIYLSGLFKTEINNVFSLDIKDKITGVRIMYNAIFENEGQIIKLEKKTVS